MEESSYSEVDESSSLTKWEGYVATVGCPKCSAKFEIKVSGVEFHEGLEGAECPRCGSDLVNVSAIFIVQIVGTGFESQEIHVHNAVCWI